MQTNFHTHTWRCKHAEGDIGEYCRAAVAQGYDALGFSDHAPLPDNRWLHVRMTPEMAPEYLAAIDAAKNVFTGLHLLKGFECEYDDVYVNWFRDELLDRMGAEYLVAGCHWFPHHGAWLDLYGRPMQRNELTSYAEYCVEAMESGLFTFLAHPDAFGLSYPEWDTQAENCARIIAEAAAAFDVALEINASGFRKRPVVMPNGKQRRGYPWLPFWETAAQYRIKVVICSDAHVPDEMHIGMRESREMAEKLGIEITHLPHLWQKK